MEFVFHSVYNDGPHAKYFNVYKVDEDKFFAECHHFNRERDCTGDFEIVRHGEDWDSSDPRFLEEAKYIGTEIERMEPHSNGRQPG